MCIKAMDTIPDAAIKAVAKRLKRYIDVERREEGFDTSGPLKPLGHYHVGRGLGGTFHYNSLQDKHMQHYYHQPQLRKHLIEMGIVQAGMFGSKPKPRQRSKSAGHRSSKTLKRESTWLMETSAKVLLEQSNGLDSGSVPVQISSNHSKSTKSGYSTPQRRQRRPRRLSQSDVESNCSKIPSSGRTARLQQTGERDIGKEESSTYFKDCSSVPSLNSPHFHGEAFTEGGDCLDAPNDSQVSVRGTQHQQMINPIHQSHTQTQITDVASNLPASSSFHQSTHQQPLLTRSTLSKLAIQTGVSVVNVASRSAQMMQESVSVSTVSSCDASTQTLIHAETQTEQSTLFKMSIRHRKRIERELKKKPSSIEPMSSITNDVIATCGQTFVDDIDTNIGNAMVPIWNGNTEILEGSTHYDNTIAVAGTEFKLHTNIHDLVACGDVTKMKELLADNPSLVNSLNGQGHTPLHIACTSGKSHVIQVLGLFGADLLTQTPTGYAAMHFAAMYGNLDCLKVLFSMKCDINFQTADKQTPLHVAAMSGQLECCQWLVANNADLNAQDNSRRTPYEIAKENDHHDVCHYLLNNAGRISQTDTSLDDGIILPTLEDGPQYSNNDAESSLLAESDIDGDQRNNNYGNKLGEKLSGAESANKSDYDSNRSSPSHYSNDLQEPATQVDLGTTSIPDNKFSLPSLNENPESYHHANSHVAVNNKSQDQGPILDVSHIVVDKNSNGLNNEREMQRNPSPTDQYSQDIKTKYEVDQQLVPTSSRNYYDSQHQHTDPPSVTSDHDCGPHEATPN